MHLSLFLSSYYFILLDYSEQDSGTVKCVCVCVCVDERFLSGRGQLFTLTIGVNVSVNGPH